MAINLQRVVGGTIEEEDEVRRDDDRFQGNDARVDLLQVEPPPRCGRGSVDNSREEGEKREGGRWTTKDAGYVVNSTFAFQ